MAEGKDDGSDDLREMSFIYAYGFKTYACFFGGRGEKSITNNDILIYKYVFYIARNTHKNQLYDLPV
jgi:hypothetical protein